MNDTNTAGKFSLAQSLKAVVAAVVSGIVAFLSSLLTALQGPTEASQGFDSITTAQWLTAMLAFFIGLGVAGGTTYRVSNK
jgi:hypothetical protein